MDEPNVQIELMGQRYDPQEMPVIFYGRHQQIAYVVNAKAACTLSLNFLFFSVTAIRISISPGFTTVTLDFSVSARSSAPT
jgi:hypothetical protein